MQVNTCCLHCQCKYGIIVHMAKRKVKGLVIDRAEVRRLMVPQRIPNQQELSRHTGIGYYHLCRLFAGSGWNHRTLSRLCSALKCEPNDILVRGKDEV